ncbi:MAG: MerR family transcriptional regulator [Chloroflexota bacterium]
MCTALVAVEAEQTILELPGRRPVYPISIAAEILGVHQRTLRIYEEEGLLIPARRGLWRFYSEEDLKWARAIRHLLHDKGLNVAGVRRILSLVPCWDVMGCSAAARESCPKATVRSRPCWVVAPRSDGKCHLCPVYQSACRYVCDEEELESSQSH